MLGEAGEPFVRLTPENPGFETYSIHLSNMYFGFTTEEEVGKVVT